ncbi:MAG: hypothetical protein V5A38_10800 [Halolamina sp.]|uniref:hypothetical protein n=1 Tax=Halolamina sp. TaxID=1940283 RepID=UPI002FC39D73
MILRVWHGWTAPEDPEAYEAFLAGEGDPDRTGGSDSEESQLAPMAGDGYRS